jgi:hypothetical protein
VSGPRSEAERPLQLQIVPTVMAAPVAAAPDGVLPVAAVPADAVPVAWLLADDELDEQAARASKANTATSVTALTRNDDLRPRLIVETEFICTSC